MANELVQVELIANPAVKRTMTMASYRNNSHKWRISGAEQVQAPQVQKKSVEPAAAVNQTAGLPNPGVVEIKSISTQGGETDFIGDPTTTATEGAENVTTTIEPTGLIDGLRAQYKASTGKDADKRWGVKKLSEEIKNLNTPA
jgi:hypothetical protein